MFGSSDVTVLDIGSHKITAVFGKRTAKGVFCIKAVTDEYYDGYQQGEWLSEDSLFRAVKTVLEKLREQVGARSKKLYVGVPGEFSAVKCKQVSLKFGRSFKVTDEEIDRLFEKGDSSSSDPDYTVVNTSAIYYVCDDNDKRIIEPRGLTAYKLTGLVSYVYGERSFTGLLESFAERLGFKEVEFLSVAWAETMSLFEPEQRDKYVLLVEVGYISTTVSLARGDGLLSIGSFSIGGAHISADLSQVLDVPFLTAEDIKEKIDLNLAFSESDKYEAADKTRVSADLANEIARARLENIAEYVVRALELADIKCPAYVPVFLTGGGVSFMRGAKEFLADKIGKSVEIIAPTAPGFNKPNCSSLISLLDVASRLSSGGKKSLFGKLSSKS